MECSPADEYDNHLVKKIKNFLEKFSLFGRSGKAFLAEAAMYSCVVVRSAYIVRGMAKYLFLQPRFATSSFTQARSRSENLRRTEEINTAEATRLREGFAEARGKNARDFRLKSVKGK
jgi:hypothetical protein